MDKRSFYIDEYNDEIMPCDGSLQGWADWLAKPSEEWGREHPADDGAVFEATAIAWQPDIIATRSAPGEWSLSREPSDDEFVAVRYGKALGWSPDQIVSPNVHIDPQTSEITTQPMRDALREWLRENDGICDDQEFVAVGAHEAGWSITFRAGPPSTCTAERAN